MFSRRDPGGIQVDFGWVLDGFQVGSSQSLLSVSLDSAGWVYILAYVYLRDLVCGNSAKFYHSAVSKRDKAFLVNWNAHSLCRLDRTV